MPLRDVGDLVEKVDELAGPSDEVACSQLLVEDAFQLHPAGPLVGRPREPRVGLAQKIEMVLGLRGVQPAPQPHHPGQRGADRSRYTCHRRLARRAGDPVSTGFKDQCGHGSGQLGRRQLVPDALAQALDHEQVGFAVHPGQLPSRRSDAVIGQVAQLGKQCAHAVEGSGDRVGPPLDPAFQNVGVTAQPHPPLGPAQMVLALGAAMDGVGTQRPAQLGEPGIIGGCRALAVRPGGPGFDAGVTQAGR